MSLTNIDFARVKLVTFDVGDTLLTPHPSIGEVYAEMLLKHGVTLEPTVINKRFGEIFKQLRDAPLHQTITEETANAFWRVVVQHCILPECPADLVEVVFAQLWNEFSFSRRWRALPGAKELLCALAASRHRKIAVLSNWDRRLRQVLDELNWASLLNGIFISSELGFEKPDLRVFRAVEQTLQVPASACLHVGDSYVQDYRAAIAAGWQAALLSANTPVSDPPITQFKQLHDLIPFLA